MKTGSPLIILLCHYLPFFRNSIRGHSDEGSAYAPREASLHSSPSGKSTIRKDSILKKRILRHDAIAKISIQNCETNSISNRNYKQKMFTEIKKASWEKKYVYSDLTFINHSEKVESWRANDGMNM
jgi:hypothetical protein